MVFEFTLMHSNETKAFLYVIAARTEKDCDVASLLAMTVLEMPKSAPAAIPQLLFPAG